jgi:filamentous hemagglutinin family protein
MAARRSKLLIVMPVVVVAISVRSVAAQIATDGTTGPRLQLSGPEFAIGPELGTQAGHNLFHSFEKFSLATGERATFSGPDDVRNIISRVTGGTRSDIDGTIRSTIAGADFYFINPAGIVFGPNASLDLQGSFYVSTADELRFADGTKFSATDPTASSFTVAAPEAFGFLGADPAPILVGGSTLEVPGGDALSLVGGEITVIGSEDSIVSSAGGTVALVALGGPGAAPVDRRPTEAVPRADITLGDDALVQSAADGGGRVRLFGGHVLLRDHSFVLAANLGDHDFAGDAAAIDIDAKSLELVRGGGLISSTFAHGGIGTIAVAADSVAISTDGHDDFTGMFSDTRGDSGPAGAAIGIVADRLFLDDGAEISSATFGAGGAGAIEIQASEIDMRRGALIRSATQGAGHGGTVRVVADRVRVRDATERLTGITSDANQGSGGDAGDVILRARNVEISGGGVIRSSTFASGAAGKVRVRAGHLVIDGAGADIPTAISSSPDQGSTGAGGSVDVRARTIEIRAGGTIRATTFGAGDAGRVTIRADRILIDNDDVEPFTGISSSADEGRGNGGSIEVHAGELIILDGALIRTTTFTEGNAGTIAIDADRLVIARNGAERITGIDSSTQTGSVGRGGEIHVHAGEIQVLRGGSIGSATSGPGGAGPVQIHAGHVLLARDGDRSPTGIFTQARRLDAGPAGPITIRADSIELRGGAVINSDAAGIGNAGAIEIDADSLRLDHSRITTEALTSGGGRIVLNIDRLLDLDDDSTISSTVLGDETTTAGDVTIDPRFIVLDRSRIIAQADRGRGGNIKITVDNLIASPDSEISASAERGIDGTVVISTPEVDLSAGLVVLEGAIIDTESLPARCGARRDIGASSFTGVGRGGLPPSPDGPLSSAHLGAAGGTTIPTRFKPTGDAASVAGRAGLAPPCTPLN